MIVLPIIHGFFLGAGLIIAIGPQNVFVISQGIKQEHVLLSALICILVDSALIVLGIIGIGALFSLHPRFILYAHWGASVFLMIYAGMAFYAAINPSVLAHNKIDSQTRSTKHVITILLCLSLLNPHVYLDNVVLLGSVAVQNAGEAKYLFGLGAILASICWFLTIAYGSKILIPLFKKKNAWRTLDLFVGITMLIIALSCCRM